METALVIDPVLTFLWPSIVSSFFAYRPHSRRLRVGVRYLSSDLTSQRGGIWSQNEEILCISQCYSPPLEEPTVNDRRELMGGQKIKSQDDFILKSRQLATRCSNLSGYCFKSQSQNLCSSPQNRSFIDFYW